MPSSGARKRPSRGRCWRDGSARGGVVVYSRGRQRMRALLQRVIEASVEADDQVIGKIDRGVVTLVGVAQGDGPRDSQYLAEKILHLRIFDDAQGKLNH